MLLQLSVIHPVRMVADALSQTGVNVLAVLEVCGVDISVSNVSSPPPFKFFGCPSGISNAIMIIYSCLPTCLFEWW